MKSLCYSVIVLAVMLGGCAMSSNMRTFTIAGGQTIELPVARGGALPTENADVKIEVTGFMLDGQAKEITYAFGFTEKKRETPRSIKVEDVTGSSAELLVEDKSPRLDAKGYWKGSATPRKKGDPGLSWLNEAGDTTKVFRFTIATADGRELVMHQASVWGGASKPMIRQMLDEKGLTSH
jgi:hypothetical protein